MKIDYRTYVGPKEKYDLIAATQFNLLTYIGLREHHHLLDIGCGSLRAGRLFIPYLLPGRYYGIEPNKWLIEDAIKHELGEDMIRIKKPQFDYNEDFTLTIFNRQFDYLLAHSIFTHAPQKLIRRCLAEAVKTMKEKSRFVATFKRGAEDYGGKSWSYPDGITYTGRTMLKMIEEQGLKGKQLKWNHPSSQTWMIITKHDI